MQNMPNIGDWVIIPATIPVDLSGLMVKANTPYKVEDLHPSAAMVKICDMWIHINCVEPAASLLTYATNSVPIASPSIGHIVDSWKKVFSTPPEYVQQYEEAERLKKEQERHLIEERRALKKMLRGG